MSEEILILIIRLGVAGAVLRTPSSLVHSFVNWVTLFLLTFKSSLLPNVRASELTFWENVHPTMCHMSHVKCHMSGVTCNLFLIRKKLGQSAGGSVINGAYPVNFFFYFIFLFFFIKICLDYYSQKLGCNAKIKRFSRAL